MSGLVPASSRPSILGVVTGGAGDARRLRRLCEAVEADVTIHEVDRARPRAESTRAVRAALEARPWALVVLEGTGIAGGLPLIRAARARGQRYVVSSGDPVGGFFRTVRGPLWGAAFGRYERWLYRHSAGFVGWTPYLCGLALALGAPRAMTVEGGVDLDAVRPPTDAERAVARARFGVPEGHLVAGVMGSIQWSPRQRYAYGLELVEALARLRRDDVTVLVVGDGDGRAELERRVPPALRDRAVFTGRLAAGDVPQALHAMDVGFITQTLDGLGSFRLTTKLPEYLAAGLPVAMSPIPGFYDYAREAGWALPPHHPASADFHDALARWLDALAREEVAARRAPARRIAEARFGYDDLAPRFAAFLHDLLAGR